MNKKTVIVLGKGELAIRVANWFNNSNEYVLKYIVPTMLEPKWQPSITNWANINNIQIIESGHYKDIPFVESNDWKVDLAISVTYNWIIKSWFINKCKRILNIHNGPLPRYRGVSPINWALKNNESEHGVTIHEIDPEIDTGPIISQLKYSIYPEFDEVITVYNRATEYGWVLFQQTIPILDKIKAVKQDNSKALYYNLKQDILLGDRKNFTRELSR
jgi:methionyl-tRNA formyltransferase